MRLWSCVGLLGFGFGALASCGGLAQRDSDKGTDHAVAAAGDGGSASSSGGRGGSGAAGAGGSAGGLAGKGGAAGGIPNSRVPQQHRARHTDCDHERPPGNARFYGNVVPCPEDGGVCAPPDGCPECTTSCVDYHEGAGPQCVWTYSQECSSDADCTANDNGRCQSGREQWYCTYDTCFTDATCSGGGPCACEGESGTPGNTCMPGNCQIDDDCGTGSYCSPTFGGCGNYSGVIAFYCHTPADTCVDDADCGHDPSLGGVGYCMYTPELGHWACGYGQCVG